MEGSSNSSNNASSSRQRQRVSWENDGVADGPSSIDILVEWLSEQHNYARWKGQGGTTKEALLTEIVNKLKVSEFLALEIVALKMPFSPSLFLVRKGE